MRTTKVAILLLVCCALPPAGAQLLPQGPQFQVNSYSTDEQYESAVATLTDGGFLVVWESFGSGGNDFLGFSVQARRFGSDGAPASPEFQVNSYIVGDQRRPDVAPVGDGVIIVWHGPDNAGTGEGGVLGQRFDQDGNPFGPEFMVSGSGSSAEGFPEVAALDDGGFVVAWECAFFCPSDYNGYGVLARRYDADGDPEGPSVQVNTYLEGRQLVGDVAGLADGGFVVLWASTGSSGGDTWGYSIQGQRFGAGTSPAGAEFQVNNYTTGHQTRPVVAALAAGGFVVAWQSDGSDGSDTDSSSVQVRRFDASGSPVGGQFQVNGLTTGAQGSPSLGVTADDSFVVVWTSGASYGSDTSTSSIQARHFAADGTPLATQFQVNSYTTSSQFNSAIAPGAGDDLVIAWQSDGSAGGDDSTWSVQAQRFRRAIFADGFEDGTTDAWSVPDP